VRPDPLEDGGARAVDGGDQRGRGVGRQAEAAHARVDLHVHARPAGHAGGLDRPERRRVDDRQRHVGRDQRRDAGADRPEQQHESAIPPRRSASASSAVATPNASTPHEASFRATGSNPWP
jgi:hypothetical protein